MENQRRNRREGIEILDQDLENHERPEDDGQSVTTGTPSSNRQIEQTHE